MREPISVHDPSCTKTKEGWVCKGELKDIKFFRVRNESPTSWGSEPSNIKFFSKRYDALEFGKVLKEDLQEEGEEVIVDDEKGTIIRRFLMEDSGVVEL